MIDLHTHVLAGVDDGSPNLEESVRMVRMAAETGTTDLVATPHASLEYRFDPEVVEQKLAELAGACDARIRLHLGCDFHFYFDNILTALAHPTKFTINHGKYLLVELSDLLIVKTIDEMLAQLQGAGMVPIITHPERNFLLRRRLERVQKWVEQGCLIQVTAQSFLGRFGREAREACRELTRLGLVHFVASDGHDSQDRPPRLDLAYRDIARRYSEAMAERLFRTNPRAVLADEPLPEAPPPEPAKKWYQFWAR